MSNEAMGDEAAAREARRMVAVHGRHAHQVVVDEIVAAIRDGDDARASRRGEVLQAMEGVRQAMPVAVPPPSARMRRG